MIVRRTPSLGLLFALLALVMQIGFSAALPRSDADALLAVTTLCHSDDGGPAPSSPHPSDCALCPLCATIASVSHVLPANGPALPRPRALPVVLSRALPQPTVPLSTPRFATQARAPPFHA